MVSASTSDTSAPTYTVPLTVADPPAAGVFVTVSNSTTGIQRVSAPSGATSAPQVTITFIAAKTLGAGTYTDQVTMPG